MALVRRLGWFVAVLAIAVVAVQLATLSRAGSPGVDDAPRDEQVLARVEVRGSSTDPAAGRSPESGVAAPGSSPTSTPTSADGSGSLTDAADTSPPEGATEPLPTTEPAVQDDDAGAVDAAEEATTDAPTDASQTEVRVTAASEDLDARGAEALALIAFDWELFLPGWTISFEPPREGLRGLTYTSDARIEVLVRDGETPWEIARVVAHELGHAIDLARNEVVDRRLWRAARGIDPDIPWWPQSGVADFASGAGDFAECAATWMVGSATLSQLAGDCTADQLELVATMATA